MSVASSLRRRFIVEDDLDAIAALLAAGFPARKLAVWRRGLDAMRRRAVPAGRPRFGLMLEAAGRPCGVLLMIFAEVEAAGCTVTRCNLSSWHVEPPHAGYASLLLSAALKDRTVTFLNISPALHTQPVIETQGFRPFCHGSTLYWPALTPDGFGRRRALALPSGASALPEAALVEAHLALGCPCLAVEVDGDVLPFVFTPVRRVRGVLPAVQLLYCRSLDAFSRCAGALGRALLRQGAAAVLVDADEGVPGLRGRRFNRAQGRYWLGPNPPRPGDLAFTERAVFHD